MTNDKDILNFKPVNNNLTEEKLMAYLEGKLPAEEQHEIEQWLAEEGMESDALEGLLQAPPEKTQFAIKKLNLKLHRAIKKQRKRGKRVLKTDILTLIAIVVIISLTALAYIVIKMILKK